MSATNFCRFLNRDQESLIIIECLTDKAREERDRVRERDMFTTFPLPFPQHCTQTISPSSFSHSLCVLRTASYM